MWLREVCSCSCLPVLPDPAWVLLSKICILFSRSLYSGITKLSQLNLMSDLIVTLSRDEQPHFDNPLRNPLIYLEDLARSHGSSADSDSSQRSSGSGKKEEKRETPGDTPALLSRPDNFNPFTPRSK